MKDLNLAQTFIRLAQIPSPSGNEKQMILFLQNYFDALGFDTWVDNAGSVNNSNTGNLYAYLEIDENLSTDVFLAHSDTVQKESEQIKVLFDGKTFKSDGSTILSADNKAGVAALCYVAKQIEKSKLTKNLLFFFPTREEAGLMGSSQFEFNKSKIDSIYNFDWTKEFGNFVYATYGYLNFFIKVYGKSAHAAVSHSLGKNAIAISAELITQIKQGGDSKKGWTLNIGKINGGDATNVICDYVEMKGELRASSMEIFKIKREELVKTCSAISQKHSVEVKLEFLDDELVPPLNGSKESEIVKKSKKICEELGVKFNLEQSFATTDVNYFAAKGYESVIIVARGGKNAHGLDEELELKDLELTVKFLEKVIYS